jgi:hypothetical protein
MSKEMIENFLAQMRESRSEEIEAIELPEGSEAYIAERVAAGDTETLTFMLKLSYLMGLHTGYAAQQVEDTPQTARATGPLEA